MRRHRFEDGTEVDLPGGSRGDQTACGRGRPSARRRPALWTSYVDGFVEVWEAMRKDWLERPWDPSHASKEAKDLLSGRAMLGKYARRHLRDKRLIKIATFAPEFDGHDLRDVPAWEGMWSYVEQNFGAWTVPGGMGSLSEVLRKRLETRKVQLHLSTRALDLVVTDKRVAGVRTDAGDFDADHVVVAIDPRRLPTLADHVARTMPAMPPVITHIGLSGEVPDLPRELVIHGDPTLVVRTSGSAPEGMHAWTVIGRGRISEDIVLTLARAGVKVREQVRVRVDRSPKDLVQEWNGSPMGVRWQGRRTLDHRLGTRTPVDGVFLAGAHAPAGAGVAQVALSAAQVAAAIGPAD